MRARFGERLVALALFGALLLNYPLLSLVAGGGSVFGLPELYVYLFAVWAGIIAITAWLVGRAGQAHGDRQDRG